MTRWLGRVLAALGLVSWAALLVGQSTMPVHGIAGAAAILLEVGALGAATVITAAMWSPRVPSVFRHRAGGELRSDSGGELRSGSGGELRSDSGGELRSDSGGELRSLPETMAVVLSVDPALVDVTDRSGAIVGRPIGDDDTGEIAWARRGLHIFHRAGRQRALPSVRESAWAVVALEGLRRMLCVVLLVYVLLTGRSPFDVPTPAWLATLAAALSSISVGHWLLSGGRLRPGSRLVWSMASVGAGLGDGVSRSTLPIRWMATMATMVVLNLAIALRGLSDRWTHGLGAMSHDARVAAMSFGLGLVATGFLALRTLPQPDLDFYGATRRLEESSTRRLALGATVGVAVLGFVAGVAPSAGSL